MTTQPCPICGTPAGFATVAAHGGWQIECALCGSYEVTASAWPALEAAAAAVRDAALAWAKAHNQRHANLLARPCITTVCFVEAKDIRRRRT